MGRVLGCEVSVKAGLRGRGEGVGAELQGRGRELVGGRGEMGQPGEVRDERVAGVL